MGSPSVPGRAFAGPGRRDRRGRPLSGGRGGRPGRPGARRASGPVGPRGLLRRGRPAGRGWPRHGGHGHRRSPARGAGQRLSRHHLRMDAASRRGAGGRCSATARALRPRWLGPLARGERRAGIALAGLRPSRCGVFAGTGGSGRLPARRRGALGHRLGSDRHGVRGGPRRRRRRPLPPTRRRRRRDAAGAPASAWSRRTPAARSRCGSPTTSCRPTGWSPRSRTSSGPAVDAAGSALNGFLALGVARRCCQLLGSPDSDPAAPDATALDGELAACRAALLAADAGGHPGCPGGRLRAGPAGCGAAHGAHRQPGGAAGQRGTAAAPRGGVPAGVRQPSRHPRRPGRPPDHPHPHPHPRCHFAVIKGLVPGFAGQAGTSPLITRRCRGAGRTGSPHR